MFYDYFVLFTCLLIQMSLTCIPLLAQGLATFIVDAAVLGTCTEFVATLVFTLSFLYIMCNARPYVSNLGLLVE